MENHIIDDIKNNLSERIKVRFGIDNMMEIGGYQNYIYEFKTNNNEYILRVTHGDHRDKLEIEEEIKFINHLYNGGIPVAKPVSIKGNAVEEINTLNNTYFISIFDKAKGIIWRETDIDDEVIFNSGKVLGRIHRFSSNMDTKLNRTNWSENKYIKVSNKVIPHGDILEKLDVFIKYLRKLETPRGAYGLVHGDYQFANMIYSGKGITVIDFDELEYSWFAYDIAVYLFYFLLGADPLNMDIEPNKKLFKKFMEGYIEEKDIDIYWIEKLQVFLRLREYILLSSIYRSYYPDNLNSWTKSFIKASENRIINDINFVDIDYVKLFKEIRFKGGKS